MFSALLQRLGQCHGTMNATIELQDLLRPVVWDFFRVTPFRPLIEVLPVEVFQRSASLLNAFGERWCDTTYTFHWSWGKMTLTPTDIFALTRLPFSGDILSPNPRRHITLDGMQPAIGWVPARIVTDDIPHTMMIHHIKEESDQFAEVHRTRK